MDWLKSFVAESNRIEGILREPTQKELDAHQDFLGRSRIEVRDLVQLVNVLQPDAVLRTRKGLNVRVGSHIAPAGGPEIKTRLELLLSFLGTQTPFQNHRDYETLHPFTDGNGRSGRALWLWQMLYLGDAQMAMHLGFLHTFYYQTLEASDGRRKAA